MSELAWAAGLFDGEGSSGVQVSKGKYRYLQLQVGMTEKSVLDRFAAAVGVGNVAGPYRYKLFKPVWRWTATGATAERALERIWPFLSLPKKEQAEAALKGKDLA